MAKGEFEQIVVVDKTGLQSDALAKLAMLSRKPLRTYDDFPDTDEEVVRRIHDADCVFVSWNTPLSEKVLRQAEQLRYVGMCCSLYDEESANVDIAYAAKHGIVVKGIRDYGDEGLVEFVVCELIRLLKGLGDKQWRDEPVELTNKKIGIIGLGTTGKLLADRLRAFGGDLYYYSRSRKPVAEKEGIKYRELADLLNTVDILSLHLPRNTQVLGESEFAHFGNGKILVNTSLGLTFEQSAFEQWIAAPGNYAIFDADGIGSAEHAFSGFDRVISTAVVSGWTKEAQQRLSTKVMENLSHFLGEKGEPSTS